MELRRDFRKEARLERVVLPVCVYISATTVNRSIDPLSSEDRWTAK